MAFGTALAMPTIRGLGHHHHLNDDDTEPFPQVPSIEVMGAPSSPTSQTGSRRRERDTGFPEPFNDDRNTTLPYPGADLSPNARITMEDGLLNTDPFSSKRSFRRSRLNKHKRTVSYGRITPQFEALNSVMSIVDATSGMSRTSSAGTRPDTGNATTPAAPATTAEASMQASRVPATPISASYSSPRTSRDETDSFRSKRDDETPPSSPESHTSRKGGFLSRWRSRG
ncbi:hypothetical protein CC79DRAFT_1369495 [Sarocladium strictum]